MVNIEIICRAAKKRAAQQAIMSQGPQRLGGSSCTAKTMTPREAAAAAAERRARDNLWCPSAAIAAGEKTVIDLVGDSEDEADPAEDIIPSDPLRAANIPSKPCSGKTGTVQAQTVPKTLHCGGVGATGKPALSQASDHKRIPAKRIQIAPVLNRPAADSIAGKAGAAAAARAEAARLQNGTIFATPMQTKTPAKRRKQYGLQETQKNRSADPARNRGDTNVVKVEAAEQDWCVANPTIKSNVRRGSSAHASRVSNSAYNGDDADDGDDLEIVCVCCCGHAAARPSKTMQGPASAVPLQTANVQQQDMQDVHTGINMNGSAVGGTSSGRPALNASH